MTNKRPQPWKIIIPLKRGQVLEVYNIDEVYYQETNHTKTLTGFEPEIADNVTHEVQLYTQIRSGDDTIIRHLALGVDETQQLIGALQIWVDKVKLTRSKSPEVDDQ